MFRMKAHSRPLFQHAIANSMKEMKTPLITSINFVRCWVRRNFVNFVKHCLWHIPNFSPPSCTCGHVHSELRQMIAFFPPRRRANVAQVFVRVNRDSSLQYRSRAWLINHSCVENVLISCGHFFSPSLFLACRLTLFCKTPRLRGCRSPFNTPTSHVPRSKSRLYFTKLIM